MRSVLCVAISPDGSRLATSSEDGTVKLWDSQTGQEVLTLRGHTDIVPSVAFSPDGTQLATAGVDGTVQIREAGPPGPAGADQVANDQNGKIPDSTNTRHSPLATPSH